MIRVGVLGANGRMGRLVCAAVAGDPDLELAAGVDRHGVGEPVGDLIGRPEVGVRISADLAALTDAGAEVAVDFTAPSAVMDNVRWAVEHGVHVVVGTSGIGPRDLDEIEGLLAAREGSPNVLVVPNFAVGAVLMQRFAAEAARFFPAAEIVELHHEGKLDAPSGTALATARQMARARREAREGPGGETIQGARGADVEGIRVHAVRLPGLVAHQEVILGGLGQTLTIRHDSSDRSSFMPGVLMAVKAVGRRSGLTVGLEPLLGLAGGEAGE